MKVQATKLFTQGMQRYKIVSAAASVLVTATLLATSAYMAHRAEENIATYVPPENRITVTAPRLVAADVGMFNAQSQVWTVLANV